MNKTYVSNMSYIKKLNLDLFNKVNKSQIINIEVAKCKNNKKNIVKKYNGNNVFIHSSYDPEKQAKHIARHVIDSKADIVFMIGLGLGYELKEMIKEDDNKRYFIVEPDEEIFKTALQNIDITFLSNNNVYFIQDDRYENIVNFFQSLVLNDKNINIKFFVLPAYELLHKNLIQKINEFIIKWLNVFSVSLYTNIVHQRQWFQNYAANLKYLSTTCPVEKLKDGFKNKPAIIVGAGPSLTYNLEHLKDLGDKAIIVGAGTGLSVLEKNKIKAHIAGAIDGSELEEKLFQNLDVNKQTTLFYSHNVYYTVPSMLNGNKFLINVNQMDNFVGEKLNWDSFDEYSSASISIIMAYNLAKLGCNPIIFLGQDFCYSRNKSYAEGVEDIKGNNEVKETVLENSNYIELVNKNGEMVYSNKAFIAMKNLMENCIELNTETEFLNGTKDGLKIEGAEDIDFNQFVDSHLINESSINIDSYINKIYLNNTKSDSIEERINFTKNIESANNEIIEICKQIVNCIESEDSYISKTNFVRKKESDLQKISFYKEVIYGMIYEIDYIYKKKEYLDYCKHVYSYVLDKCLIMENAFRYEVNGGE
jgi:hypothetical protein